MFTWFEFFRNQREKLPIPIGDFTGKTVIVTGANIGTGLEAARHFARLGAAKLILACRSTEKGEAARREILETTSTTTAQDLAIEVWQVDLSAFDSVKEFCRRVNETLDRVDVVIENAGVSLAQFESGVDGYDTIITVNVISTFLMALLLLPKLRETAARFNVMPRLVLVASEIHYVCKFNEKSAPSIFNAFNTVDNFTDRYGSSKLMMLMLARELARQTSQSSATGASPVVINAPSPGFCSSSFFRNVPFPYSVMIAFLLFLFGRSSEMGSRALVHAATTAEDTHGDFLMNCRVYEPKPFVEAENGKRTQERLWAELLEILETVEPGISHNVMFKREDT
ncbi:short-chain dehydrogenase/reductase-like protein [Apodospora peruviana]|uniref:Short-chain dehydrogenase/reductase-like protein n=1 Tax=Apodospora peruviana TaxID=516989 RepID=A0AAE0IJN7_9PEZI|nr:short-chain dehydrogenase/reductase-like protein [Apodospora peruviana]